MMKKRTESVPMSRYYLLVELSILQTKVIDSADTDTFSYLILLI